MAELYRPNFHFTPPSMWLNDPNGLVYFDGEYHLFYQYHPHSTVWGPMHWGHAISRDLIHWEHLPIALYPDEQGMIFSGSAVVDKANTAGFGANAMILIFTHHSERYESQSLAYSTDRGRTWTKYAGNPVIPAPEPPSDFRDPKVFWHEDHWVLCLAAKDRILFFTSPNLKEWKQTGSFGAEYGSHGGVWETPDLFKLPVGDSNTHAWVLTVGVGDGAPAGGSGTQYFIGDFDGDTFTSQASKETILWMDHGADFYAPQSWNDEPNGRRIVLGWMNNWRYARGIPATSMRGSFSIPRELTLIQTHEGIRLAQIPLHGFKTLRATEHSWQAKQFTPGENLLADLQATTFEIYAVFQIPASATTFGFKVRVGETEHTVIGYDTNQQKLFIDRTHSGQTNFSLEFPAIHAVHCAPDEGKLCLHIFVDETSVEVFANQGVALSDLIFPAPQSNCLEIFTTDGTLMIHQLTMYELSN